MDRAALIQKYLEGPDVLEAALREIGESGLDHKPADGGWSPREIVHHTADSEITSAVRLRRLVVEDNPPITGYDPDEFSRRLRYSSRPIEPSLAAIRAALESTASILKGLTEEEWSRAGTHSEMGEYSIDTWLRIYSNHCHDHAEQARRAVAGN
jgi:hypothetical protein